MTLDATLEATPEATVGAMLESSCSSTQVFLSARREAVPTWARRAEPHPMDVEVRSPVEVAPRPRRVER